MVAHSFALIVLVFSSWLLADLAGRWGVAHERAEQFGKPRSEQWALVAYRLATIMSSLLLAASLVASVELCIDLIPM